MSTNQHKSNISDRNIIKKICVYCGSSDGSNPVYANAVMELARLFVENDIQLIYGGGDLGLMGRLAKRIHEKNGKVVGIIPKALNELCGEVIGQSLIVDTMHERKSLMSDSADAFIALPGGLGTMEELVETATWSQLRIHSKPIGVLNINGFFDHFRDWLKHSSREGFISDEAAEIIQFRDSPADLLNALFEYHDPLHASTLLTKEMWAKKKSHPESSDI